MNERGRCQTSALSRWKMPKLGIRSRSILLIARHARALPISWMHATQNFRVCFGLSLLGLAGWFFARRRQPPLPPKVPREIALEELERISRQIKRMSPYQFSIRASDILRRYVTQQYGLLATRQTSIEFLTAL